jgi:hypothetical protein
MNQTLQIILSCFIFLFILAAGYLVLTIGERCSDEAFLDGLVKLILAIAIILAIILY